MLIPVIVVVAIIAFLITNVIPGDPVRLILGDFATEEQVVELERQLGIDQPLYVRFAIWLRQILQGDLGQSLFLHIPVTQAIMSRMEPTILLAIFGQTLGVLIGIPLGVIAAVKHRSWIDQTAIGVSLVGISIPGFWLALMLILFFGVYLRFSCKVEKRKILYTILLQLHVVCHSLFHASF